MFYKFKYLYNLQFKTLFYLILILLLLFVFQINLLSYSFLYLLLPVSMPKNSLTKIVKQNIGTIDFYEMVQLYDTFQWMDYHPFTNEIFRKLLFSLYK